MPTPDLWRWALAAIDLACLPWFLFLLAASLAGGRARRRLPPTPAVPRSRIRFLVPAHDEERVIAATVESCRASDYPADLFEVAVIADNCTDRTAEVARRAGALVIERADDARRSKGYAIEDVVEGMKADGTLDRLDALAIVDADSTVDPHLLRRFDAHFQSGARWIQCYDIVGNGDASWRTRLMAYQFSLINGVLLLGQAGLGLGAGLRGNGMGLSAEGLGRFPWRTHGLAEDLEFSWGLRVAGEMIAFEPDAAVHALMPVGGGKAAASQRRRWEYGRKELRRKFRRAVLASPHLGLWKKTGLLLELTLPAMVPLSALYLALSAANLSTFAAGGGPLFLGVWLVMTLALALYATGPFRLFGLPWRYAWSLLRAPQYAAWKALVMLGGKPKQWVRTARGPEARIGAGAAGGGVVKALVTGANGFLGRHVVAALLAKGHAVRAMVRPAARIQGLGWPESVEVVRADLRAAPPAELASAFDGEDVLVHLAAATSGGDDQQFAATVVGTERLLDAMARSATRRVVLCSSFSVYDWSTIPAGSALTEDSPVAAGPALYERDGYAIAKAWQERVTRRAAGRHGWDLTVIRPGFIWGPGHAYHAGLGQRLGRVHLAFGPRARLPLTYVENFADLFATAAADPRASGRTFNAVDGDDVRVWQHLGEYLRRSGERGLRVPIPYALGYANAGLARLVSRALFGRKGRLPSILTPRKFEARFKPLRFPNDRAREALGWAPPVDFEEALRRTFAPPAAGPDAVGPPRPRRGKDHTRAAAEGAIRS